MQTLLQQLINGVVVGSVYALVALGYTMVYGILGLINFAHGEVLMVGSLVALQTVLVTLSVAPGLHLLAALLLGAVVAILVCMLLGYTIERVAYRPLRNAPRLAPLITAIGVSMLLQTLAMMIWGASFTPTRSSFRQHRSSLSQASSSRRYRSRPSSSPPC